LAVEQTRIVADIQTFFADKMDGGVGSPDSDLLETGLLDSLGIVELLLHLEQTYGVELPIQEIEIDDLRSISSIAAMVRAKGNGALAADSASAA
jgi:D-alanine--poly(phosphoribitol) ligase subunit 2